ncbi:quinon protein alcohol dehydrogenase-like superfamily [Sporodiniella umbellata]|nr:quinon protein alcohol dehydrogenase-like superfamily [Sporodiniella umbellata]
MYIDFEDSSAFVASTENGIAAKCNSSTGKVDRHFFYSTAEHIPIQVSATYVSKDRIAWGHLTGYVTLLVRTKTSTNVASRLKTFSGFHQGAVKVLALPSNIPDIVVSGAENGDIKIWNISTTSCSWTLPGSSTLSYPTTLKVAGNQKIIAGYSDGSIVLWSININQLLQESRHQWDQVRRDKFAREVNEKKLKILPFVADNTTLHINTILYDSDTNTIVVSYTGHTELRKYCVDTGVCKAIYGEGHSPGNSITCMSWDTSCSSTISLEEALKPKPKNQRKGNIIHLSSPRSSGQNSPVQPFLSGRSSRLLVTGDNMGVICLWDGNETNQDGKVRPVHTLSEGHMVAISSIYVDGFKVVTGSDDGWIRVWDPLTGTNIHTFGNKIPKNAPVDRSDMNIMRVKNIWCNEYQGIATIGHQVKTWDFSPAKQLLNRRHLLPKGKGVSGNVRDRHRSEIGREMKESIQKLESEKKERQKHEQKISKLTMEGLSDEEMLHYALMISQDDSQSPVAPTIEPGYVYVEDEDDGLLKAVIASLDDSHKQNGSASNDYDRNENSTQKHAAESTDNTNGSMSQEEEIDEELRYALEISKIDK